ncbi:hypothetical protein Vafri_11049 [Volvox africanus]|uniref:Uncharacterized protein n=1 Tax=Volvox africanus TaxID=51714 RepID=A0A8J4BBL6_9CHLO|nr:hypothetical protein Vafri_11049 [Volvox africanus]
MMTLTNVSPVKRSLNFCKVDVQERGTNGIIWPTYITHVCTASVLDRQPGVDHWASQKHHHVLHCRRQGCQTCLRLMQEAGRQDSVLTATGPRVRHQQRHGGSKTQQSAAGGPAPVSVAGEPVQRSVAGGGQDMCGVEEVGGTWVCNTNGRRDGETETR